MILHTVNKSPLESQSLALCLQFIGQDDGIVLLEDGVYAAMASLPAGPGLGKSPVYALSSDVQARGLESRLRDDIKVIDYHDFVRLCAEYDIVQTW